MKISIPNQKARSLWIQAQGLDRSAPFGEGPQATATAVEHLGYVQIDVINVIERCHHHILYTRIPTYKREDLRRAQTVDKSVFEYWTHALSYVPTKDFRFFMSLMRLHKSEDPGAWYRSVKKEDLQKVLRRIRKDGPISIRDIRDDVLVKKDHPWASSKPSKRALELGFYQGALVISERSGILKRYELLERHFGWQKTPKAASEKEIVEYCLDRSLRSQGIVSLDSICHLSPGRKVATQKLIESRIKKGLLVPVQVEGIEKVSHWMCPELLQSAACSDQGLVHLLSPFDPLVIQRKRLKMIFGYEHLFEAYIPKSKRKLGYFALPVLMDDRIVAAVDLKTDRQNQELLVQQWTWMKKERSAAAKVRIEEALDRFEKFQLTP